MRIHQVKTRLSNSYVIEESSDDGASVMVVDVAIGCERYVLGFIESELGLAVSAVTAVAYTHDDPDHYGGVRALAMLCGAKIYAPYASNRYVHKFLNDPSGFLTRIRTTIVEAFRGRSWAMYLSSERNRAAKSASHFDGPGLVGCDEPIVHRFKNDEHLALFPAWRAIHTPGHSWDSCCFYHAETASLISGDTLLGRGPQNRVVVAAIYSNRRQIEKTLAKLTAMTISAVYPGHGSVIHGHHIIADEARRFAES
jgi:glyoxylase-like metal-dependent hydrolase (beta-lactamase superfamily II)